MSWVFCPSVSDGFPHKKFGWGVGGWGELYSSFIFYFWNCYNFAKPLTLNWYHAVTCIAQIRVRLIVTTVVTWVAGHSTRSFMYALHLNARTRGPLVILLDLLFKYVWYRMMFVGFVLFWPIGRNKNGPLRWHLDNLIFGAAEGRVFVWHFISASGSDLYCASDAFVIFTATRFRFRFDVGVRGAWE